MTGHADFYRELTARNAGLISPPAQRAIQECVVLIAGCGSTGGAAIEPLVRVGFEHFILAEPDHYELSNLNRQAASVSDIGQNKAKVSAERIKGINPHAEVEVVLEGVTSDNAQRLVGDSNVIVDGVDVTTHEGWQAKMQLHQHAANLRVATIVGYDLGSTQYATFYDYGNTSAMPFDGKVDLSTDMTSPFQPLARLIPAGFVPEDLLRTVRTASSSEFSVPQLVDTASVFGLVTMRALIRYLAGQRVAGEIALNMDTLVSMDAVVPVPARAVSEWFEEMGASSL